MQSSPTDLPAVTLAALFLVAGAHGRRLGLPSPSPVEALAATGASRSSAYDLAHRLEQSLASLVRPPGRPTEPARPPAPPAITREVLAFLMGHPGAISGGTGHRRYSDELRHFVLGLLGRNKHIKLAELAEAISIPLGTLKDWLAGGHAAVEAGPSRHEEPAPRIAQIATVLDEWSRWEGDLGAFATHIQQHCRLPFGRTTLGTILEAEGVRRRKSRPGRRPDEVGLRDRFQTFFPHAQWVQDGWEVPIVVDGVEFRFNVELAVDAYSGAFVGVGIGLHEDAAGVISAARDGIDAAGQRPIAILLDNKACNHTPEVQASLDPVLLIPATLYRPQNKGHVEGSFGLLQPTLAGLQLSVGLSPEDTARSFLRALIITAGRAWNGRPRKDRDLKSRLDLLEDRPTAEQVAAARAQLQELLARQRAARQTRAARQDPVVRAMLAAAYQRLGLADPTGNLLTATAGYPLAAIVEGIGIWEGKLKAGTLRAGVGADYLLGIIRNVASEWETWEIASALWRLRVEANDQVAVRLARQRDQLDDAIDRENRDDEDRITAYVDRATRTASRSERFFWLQATADVVGNEADDPSQEKAYFLLAARRIATTHKLPARERVAAARFLAARCKPIA